MATISSVQRASYTLPADTANATIDISVDLGLTDVDASKTILLWTMEADAANNPQRDCYYAVLNGAGTEIEFGRSFGSGSPEAVVEFQLVEFSSGVTVHRIAESVTSATTSPHTATVSGMSLTSTDDAFVLFSGLKVGTGSNSTHTEMFVSLYLSSTTEVTWQCESNFFDSTTLYAQVVELTSGGDITVQRGAVVMDAAATSFQTSGLTTVDRTAAILKLDGWTYVADGAGGLTDDVQVRAAWDSDTAFTVYVNDANAVAMEARYEIVEFASGVTVKEYSQAFVDTEGTKAVTLSPALTDTSKSFVLGTAHHYAGMAIGEAAYSGVAGGMDNGVFLLQLTSTSNVDVTRANTSAAATVNFQVVEFTGGASVTITDAGDEQFNDGESVTITGTGFGATQGTGRVVISPTDDIADVSADVYTTEVTSWGDTSITVPLDRNTFAWNTNLYLFVEEDGGASNASGHVIQFVPNVVIREIFDDPETGAAQANLTGLRVWTYNSLANLLAGINNELTNQSLDANGQAAWTVNGTGLDPNTPDKLFLTVFKEDGTAVATSRWITPSYE